ncbi:hypothetical protein LNQ52_18710 [Klebsiella pneumoniae subsp. pneumoniae]|nr:hypothetical protein [Klebsiella pneumoniae subsp. pneumoniae]
MPPARSELAAVIAFHHRYRALAVFRIIQRHDKHLLYLWMGEYHTLSDLFRLNTFSTAKKEVIHSPNNRQPTVMQCSAIARRKPAFIVG